MEFRADRDAFGNVEFMTADKIREILDLIDGYMKGTPYTIKEMWRDNVTDPNGRIDIEIRYENSERQLIQQKLLILKGELIDGETFHKRFNEWYGEKKEELLVKGRGR